MNTHARAEFFLSGRGNNKTMTRLNKFVEPHIDEMPGAIFRAYDDIPVAECETPTGTTSLPALAALARSLSKAYTFVSACLYTDITEPQMQAHCSVCYNPQIDEPLWSKQEPPIIP